MAGLEIRLLGTFQVQVEAETSTDFESNKVRALLAYLAVENNNIHPREVVAELFWPGLAPKRAGSNLNQAIYNLRQVIADHQAEPPYLLRPRGRVGFNPEADLWLDVHEFMALLDGGVNLDFTRVETDPTQVERLQAALDLYQGDFLDELSFESSMAFDEWLLVTRQRLQRAALNGLHTLAETYVRLGQVQNALPYAYQQVEIDPLSEGANRQLMRLLAANGQCSQALAQFERLRILLTEELRVEPEPETRKLRDQIRAQVSPGTTLPKRRDNLPSHLSPLVGRRAELAEVCQKLESPDCRLLTILGPGGSGKTRLALEAARLSRASFSDGINLTLLNPVSSSLSILPAITESLELLGREDQDAKAQLANYLREKDLLLVLDGFEHILDGAGLLAELLLSSPRLKILVTSRARLNLKSENLYRLPGMHYPAPDAPPAEILNSDAVQLLLSSLGRSRSNCEPEPEELENLHRICAQVQGMPLGILLAGSWGATFSLAEIVAQVSRSLDFLSADWADVPARQRSLRATFDYTWGLMSGWEQDIFRSLSVFRGPFSRRAAREVSGASPHELRTLVDRSLLESGTPGWYQVHELLRQYGREKLALAAQVEIEVCQRHSHFYLNLLSRLEPELKTDGQQAALSSIEFEHENIRTAWDWAAGRGMASVLEGALEALCLYYNLSVRYQDGKNSCQEAIAGLSSGLSTQDVDLILARAYIWQSCFTRLLGQLDEADLYLEKAQSHLDASKGNQTLSRILESFLNLEMGNNYYHRDRTKATACYQQSLGIFRTLRDPWGKAKALAGLGFIAHHAGNFQEAVELYSECIDLHRIHGDPRGLADALIGAGQNSLRLGLAEQGERFINEGVQVLLRIGDQAGAARGYFELARFLYWSGSFTRAYQLVGKSTAITKDLGILDQNIFEIIGIGLVLLHLGRYQEAITVVLDGIPLAKELDARREIGLAYLILGMAYLGQEDFTAAENWALKSVEQYRELNQQEEMCHALAVFVYTQLNLGCLQQARRYISDILQVSIDINGIFPVLHILFAVARILIEGGEIEKALEISALAERYPFVRHSQWFEDIAGREIAAAAETLPPEVVAAAQERGRPLDLWETAQALLEELSELEPGIV